MIWRCGVCEGVNQGGEACAICGASRVAASVGPPTASPPMPRQAPFEPVAGDALRPPEPPRRRGLFGRMIDAAAGAVERALSLPPLPHEPPPEPDLEPAPRRRPRMRVRPFPFGFVVTWESDAKDDPR